MLINDEFGNFVIQAILDHFVTISKRKQKMDVRVSCFYEFIRLNLGKLCKQQYSSRVVEKAVETMPKEQFEKVCNVFMKHSNKKCKMYKEIMLDSYGNYIAPKILERAKGFNLHQFESFKQVSHLDVFHPLIFLSGLQRQYRSFEKSKTWSATNG